MYNQSENSYCKPNLYNVYYLVLGLLSIIPVVMSGELNEITGIIALSVPVFCSSPVAVVWQYDFPSKNLFPFHRK